ncbi:hypothetical protein PAPYR_10686 [Paratrimastix pyriformis]|uniref:Uncharacterized protein n=1 Tax=Paratrimastix pyriformis TaxID=342808 RepID=A0ABQ8UB31_9EUKA|nr:hypothetical protein PAPYR_10686 [Paratrimastix pyriformis]
MKLWMIFRVAHSLGPDILVTFAGQRALESEENTLTTLTDSEGFSSDRSGTTRRVPIRVTLNAVIFLFGQHGLNSLIDNVLVPQNWYHRSSPNSRSTTTQPPSRETRRHGTRAPSGTDSLALEAMSEGPLIQHSSSALIGNA